MIVPPPLGWDDTTEMCDVSVKPFFGVFFIVVPYFTALGSVGNYDHSNRSMTLVIFLSIIFSSLNKSQDFD